MSVPEDCTVLIVGGGPGGSYAASVLAREGINTVVLEADVFPRYHIGESLLPTTRHYLNLIDLSAEFESHGFVHKKGAAFRFNSKPAAYTDFLAAGGPNNHAWNVIRSEADNILFQHAGKSGAEIFDGVKVHSLHFLPYTLEECPEPNPGKPVSASWTAKDGTTGTIRFKYLVDASGRAGLVSTKYLKNRSFNDGLKNVASWGYFRGAGRHGVGTPAEGAPYFHVLEGGTGWAWFIPLHNGTTSVGVVMQQSSFTAKKKAITGSKSSKDFFLASVKEAGDLNGLLEHAELVSEVKSASDWSYNASCYASPHVRIVGDAGCFIDPLFSSGVHLALTGALSAAVTICASLKGQCSETFAAKWHSQKVREGYTRFLLAVSSSYSQMMGKERPVLNEIGEENFDRAFDMFRPIIQGTVEVGGKLTEEELAQSVNFCLRVIKKIDGGEGNDFDLKPNDLSGSRSPALVKIINANQSQNPDTFQLDAIDGMTANVTRGDLGLVHTGKQ